MLASRLVSTAPALPAEITIGDLTLPLRTLPSSTPVVAVDELFRQQPALTALAVLSADGPGLLTRSAFQQLLIGPLGYGRAVNERKSLQDLAPVTRFVLPIGTPLSLAAQLLLDRPVQDRYDDVLVSGGAEGLGLLTVSAVFAQLARHFAHQSRHDPLTGLPNRLVLADGVRGLPAPAHGADAAPALLYVDLDGFKAVNDEFGHDVGDAVLQEYAQRLQAAVRPGDIAARLGGDEFALLLVDAVTDQQAAAVADRLVLLAAAPFLIEGQVVSLGASVGVARAAGSAELRTDPVESLLRAADSAMYRAKSSGRGHAVHALSGHPALLSGTGADLSSRLRDALNHDRLHLAYQGKYELRTGRLIELEALARWQEPEGPISPAVFIPAAERTGLIHPLGRWALETACRQAVSWRDVAQPGGTGPVVAVNVSPYQLTDDGFVAGVAEVLRSTGLPAQQLCLEITETRAIADLVATRQQLVQLRALGVLIALDDFGTGHSSLTLLRELPLDWVKIDRSFVEDVASDPAGAVLVRLVIEAAHSLGVLVCAEGVERPEQLAQLTAMGCDAVQGFLLAVPTRVPDLGPSPELAGSARDVEGAHRILLAGPGQLVLLCTLDGRITYASAESVHLLGYQPAEMTGQPVCGYLTPAAQEALRNEPVPRTGPLHLRPVVRRDGTVVWLEASVRVVSGRADQPAELLVTAVDVTGRVTAERALADREDWLGAAFDEAPIGMALTSPSGQHLKVNAALCRLLGRTESELLTLRWQDVTHPGDRERDDARLRSTLAGDEDGYQLEKRYVRPDGSDVDCLLQVRVVRSPDRSARYVVAHVQSRAGWV